MSRMIGRITTQHTVWCFLTQVSDVDEDYDLALKLRAQHQKDGSYCYWQLVSYERLSMQDFKRHGWRRVADLGWVCPSCLGKGIVR